MSEKVLSFSMVCACLLLWGLVTSVALAQPNGPKTSDMRIHIFSDIDAENQALEAGVIDIGDSSLSQEWFDRWRSMSEKIAIRTFPKASNLATPWDFPSLSLGLWLIDMNNQQWPLGAKGFYDPGNINHNRSREFRKAVAYLIDRDSIVRDILEGYSVRADLPLSPYLSDCIDMPLYRSMDIIYDYNKAKAAGVLDVAGFVDTDSDGIRNDPTTGDNLEPLMFYVRMDYPHRRQAGEMLAAELESLGVPVNLIVAEKIVCYKNVMVLYDYHLYTGGWSLLSIIPDQYYDLYSSYKYWAPMGWSMNYPGFLNHEFDVWAEETKYPATFEDAYTAAKECGRVFLENCPVVPMYFDLNVYAYGTGWQGKINNIDFSLNNYWSFLNMHRVADDRIDWGFRNDIKKLNFFKLYYTDNPWTPDWRILDLIYDSMLGYNPFNIANTECIMADSFRVETWDSTAYADGDPNATKVIFNLRNNGTHPIAKWHYDNASITIEDVWFSFNFTLSHGPPFMGAPWENPGVPVREHVHIINATAIEIPFIERFVWAVEWVGRLPIIRKSIWEHVPGGNPYGYDPVTDDKNGNGVIDLKEDGCGPWTFDEYNPGNYIALKAFDQYYLTQTYIESRLAEMFRFNYGDVDESGAVGIRDLSYMQRALGTQQAVDPIGTDWDEYNPNCDLDQDGKVDATDLSITTTHFGETID